MLVSGERMRQECPIMGPFESGWSDQCPFMNQWSKVQDNGCSVYNPSDCQVQYNKNYYVPQYQQPPQVYCQSYFPPPPPIVPNLPCQQGQQWDYNSMCFNVNGQPCQYTNVVDLEDFMNNEKRKEKSRVAARCRRTKEMQYFAELTAAIPAKKEELEQLDKASVMRMAISYLRTRDVVSLLPKVDAEKPIQSPKGLEEVSSELSYMKALDGFVLVLSQQGDIVYCSENIADHIGVSQLEIMGQSVFEFSHPCDHDDIREALRANGADRRELLLRLKCTLTSKGRNVHLKSASYKVIHVTGHMLMSDDKAKTAENNNNDDEKKDGDEKKLIKNGSLIAVGRPIPHPSNIEIPLDNKTFLSQHSLDMKFTYTDKALLNTLGFEPDELVGHSLYDYHHAADSACLVHQFKSLFSKGQCETGQYRFLAKTGGYAWVQTQATLITDKQQKPVSVVCVNYVISGIECKDEVFAAHQVQYADLKPKVQAAPSPAPIPVVPIDIPNGAIVGIVPEEERTISVTEQVFAPRKKEMNKGFLMFSQDEGHTMLKEEPEDLTHLAPTAGDVLVHLENNPFDMFDDFILSDNYCSLLGDDLGNGSPGDSLTESLLLSSPEPETESSCEQSSLLTEISLDAFDSARSDNDIEDGNSPFIPSSDELPVLESAVMWGALPDNVSQARPQRSEAQTSSPAPALQSLLAAPPTGPPPQDLITNIYSDQGLIPSRSVSTWDTGVKRVIKHEEEPSSAKRAKRSPSPAPAPAKASSSVLMNLLDISQKPVQQIVHKLPSYQLPQHATIQNKPNVPLPVINLLQTVNKQLLRNLPVDMLRGKTMPTNPMAPLTLNVGSPVYLPSSPNTPNYSPALSPAQRDRVLSPYTPQSLSPVGRYQFSPASRASPSGLLQGSDPYLSKMQPSPNLQQEIMMETNQIPEFWSDADTDMLQGSFGNSDLLTAFDDVKLV